MTISMNGFGAAYATLEAAAGLEPGIVALSGNRKVDAAAAGKAFAGVAVSVRDGLALVQLSGVCRLPYTGTTAPTVGYCKLVADGAGGIKVADTGRELLVTAVDSTGKTAEVLL